MSILRSELETYLDELLNPGAFADYGPNGLQIEGAEHIDRIAFAVSATAHSTAQAAAAEADALVVHHGLFWNFHGPKPLVGPFARRVFPLVRGAINLFAYHLPLDAHPVVGNAAQLAGRIGLGNLQPFGDFKGCPTGAHGTFARPVTAAWIREQLNEVLDHSVLLASPDSNALIHSAGVITGGANRDWALAASNGLDAFITGEMSEHDWHEAQEAGIHMFAGGHNATEQFGIQALMTAVETRFDIPCLFIPSDNPA